MSATIEVPRGLDKLDPAEQALFESMRADDRAPEPDLPDAPDASPDPSNGAGEDSGPWIEVDDLGHVESGSATRAPSDHQRRIEAAEARAQAAERARATDAAVFQERMNMLAAVAQSSAPPAVEAPIPDINADPIRHFQAVSERNDRRLSELHAAFLAQQQGQQRAQQVAQLRTHAERQEVAFMAREPNYAAAMEHLKAGRAAELDVIGVTDPGEQWRIMANDIHAIALKAQQDGADFAERLFKAAQKRGFRPAARTGAPAASVGRGNPTTPTARSAPVRLTADAIANMSDAQFEKTYERLKANPAALRQLMGH